jgi:hypothetical protein
MKSIYLAIFLASNSCVRPGPIIEEPNLPIASEGTTARVTFNSDGSLVLVDFGSVAVGQSPTEILRFYNVGPVDLTISRVATQVWTHPDWEIAIYDEQKIASEGPPLVIPIRFAPTSRGLKNLKVLATTDSSVVPTIEFDLTGRGIIEGEPSWT